MTAFLPIHLMHVLIPFCTLAGVLVSGLYNNRTVSCFVTIGCVLLSCILSIATLRTVFCDHVTYHGILYTWMFSDNVHFDIGFLIDRLTSIMMCVVTFVSLMVHVYSIGYMQDDPGCARFFSYISLFTFSMLMLVMADNFLQLFFGWEAVGVVSYLLIGFWYTRPSATFASLKAFLVNRVGDFGFLLGIGLIVAYTGSLHYADVFMLKNRLASISIAPFGVSWNLVTVICCCLFVGAMGKSAQFPLHVWLPDSMEGPTPISALIHAATMVTAGIYMVTRMSPLYELSSTALHFVLIIGAITSFFMGLLGVVQFDIKRIIAYSTLSQLGYMTVALGLSAYPLAIFHLVTHAFFKALLFLAAGSVIVAMHHEQDIRYMAGQKLRQRMPITWLCTLVGSLALVAVPLFSGFYSKDLIIEAAHLKSEHGGMIEHIAYLVLLLGVFVTSLYSFRLYFIVFHGSSIHNPPPHDAPASDHSDHHAVPHESPYSMTIPLIILAIPSLVIGYLLVGDVVRGSWLGEAFHFDIMQQVAVHFQTPLIMAKHGLLAPPFWFMLSGICAAWFGCNVFPHIAAWCSRFFPPLYALLVNKYYCDDINQLVWARGSVFVGKQFSEFGDRWFIDGLLVNGAPRLVTRIAGTLRAMQTGCLYQYALTFFVCVSVLLIWQNFIF